MWLVGWDVLRRVLKVSEAGEAGFEDSPRIIRSTLSSKLFRKSTSVE